MDSGWMRCAEAAKGSSGFGVGAVDCVLTNCIYTFVNIRSLVWL